jgi:hypothetical protein
MAVPKRDDAASRSQRPVRRKQTEQERAAARANTAKGRAARQKIRDEAEPGRDTQRERWAKLLSGTITAKDLDDDELDRMRVKGKDGCFNGPAPAVPSHIIQAITKERIRRARADLERLLTKATKRLEDVLDDPETKQADLLKAIAMVQDRVMGKPEQTVHYTEETEFERMSRDSVGLDREMADMQAEDSGQDG